MVRYISFSAIKGVWEVWNIRGAILFSLLLQVLLIFVAPIRRSSRRKIGILLIWLAYLVADAAANFAVGLISNSQRASNSNKAKDTTDLLAFWAPFLLVHLGGPDTITAFALEDNQLYLRHLLGLIVQAVAVLYVIIQSLPNKRLLIPTILMFIAGTIKYAERTLALYFASLDKFRDSMLHEPDPGPNYAKLMEEYAFKREQKLPTRINMTPEPDKEVKASDVPPKEGPLNHLEVVHYAYKYFKIFKGLVVDLIFSFRERDDSRDFFIRRSAEDALRVIEVELNFIYGTLYTKVEVVHRWWGYVLRLSAFGSTLAALGFFYFQEKKGVYNGVETAITYTLLLGAVALDIVSFVMLIFSDPTIAGIKDPLRPPWYACIYNSFLPFKKPLWRPCNCNKDNKIDIEHQLLATPLLLRRWSGSVQAHNLIRYCLESKCTTIHQFPNLCFETICCVPVPKSIGDGKQKFCQWVVGKCFKNKTFRCLTIFIEDLVDEMLYVSREPFSLELWDFIFKELKNKSEFADTPETAKRICSARGDWVLEDTESQDNHAQLLKYVTDRPYDESLLLWHIATDLLYYRDKTLMEGDKLSDEEKQKVKNNSHRQYSKILSDYMLYLLIFQPTMMSAVGGIGKIRFRDTCEEAKRFFKRRSLGRNDDQKACEEILSVNTDVEPVTVKGDRSKSVLFDASMLAKELIRLEDEKKEDKWKLMSRVWVELVSFAASHCRASTHAEQVSKGGELVTFFWLLMAHFGLGEQFQINEGHARAKLIVGK
ncbi:hypothetical protein PTKIN_Ptkin04bG0235400 [Pterospermum kingtungense]